MNLEQPKLGAAFKLDYNASPTLSAFHNSSAFVRGIRGPIGSGKSVACCIEIFIRARQQIPSVDGIRRSRWAVVRNTGPELETTTIKTWLDWFPEAVFGKLNRKPPITHRVKIDDTELEIIFLALDRPDDVKKLLSLEVTGIWFNEARFIHKDIVDAGTGRVGRYPAKKEKPDNIGSDQWPTWYGIIMDTNPPDDDHWWYKCAEEETPKGWEFFAQPGGLSAQAENLENLPRGYYDRIAAGKTKEWTHVFVNGAYGTIQDGKPVYNSDYQDAVHCTMNGLTPIAGIPLQIGLDFGNTPAALIQQITPTGQRRCLKELIGEDIALQEFARVLKSTLASRYPGFSFNCYGDPSGGFKDQQQKTAFDLFKAVGLVVQPAPSNKIQIRIEAVGSQLRTMSNGQPAYLIDGKECPTLRKGFNGGYRYRRLNVSGTDRYTDEPEKNSYSHIHDANQYVTLATGAYRNLVRPVREEGSGLRTVINKSNWNVWKS